jgi:hypothetical protein
MLHQADSASFEVLAFTHVSAANSTLLLQALPKSPIDTSGKNDSKGLLSESIFAFSPLHHILPCPF